MSIPATQHAAPARASLNHRPRHVDILKSYESSTGAVNAAANRLIAQRPQPGVVFRQVTGLAARFHRRRVIRLSLNPAYLYQMRFTTELP